MTIATGTATLPELVTLYVEVQKLEVMLRPYNQGDADATKPGRFTAAEVDTQIAAVTAAITAVNAA
jgi:hypothetical protein